MIPRLQRFYGGRPQDWLEMPVWLLKAFAYMLSTLHARESVHRINELACAFGAMNPGESRNFQAELTRLARSPIEDEFSRPARPKSMAELRRLMGGGPPGVKMEIGP